MSISIAVNRTATMPLRKKVRQIFSKLGHRHHESGKSPLGRLSTPTSDPDSPARPAGTRSPSAGAVAGQGPPPQPPEARTPPPITRIADPRHVNPASPPTGSTTTAAEPSPLLYLTPAEETAPDGDGGRNWTSAPFTATREDGYILAHPGEETGPESIRTFDPKTGLPYVQKKLAPAGGGAPDGDGGRSWTSAPFTATCEDGYILAHPGEETGPEFIRKFDPRTGLPYVPKKLYELEEEEEQGVGDYLRPSAGRKGSQTTSGTSATSSNYDEHCLPHAISIHWRDLVNEITAITQSLGSTPIPSTGAALMEAHRNGKHRPGDLMPVMPPTAHSSTSPRFGGFRQPSGHASSSAQLTALSETTNVSRTMAPAVIHTTICPELRENEHRVNTVEHIHHHIQPIIQPVVERQSLPTRFYLETGPGQMHEVSAQEAQEHGEPVWSGEALVQLHGGERGGDFPTQQDTIRTRLPIPRGAATTAPREFAEPLMPQESTTRGVEEHGVVVPVAAGSVQHELGNGANRRPPTFGWAGSGRSRGVGIGAGAGAQGGETSQGTN